MATYEYYLSQLDEPYLKELAADIDAQYIKTSTSKELIATLNQQPVTSNYAVSK